MKYEVSYEIRHVYRDILKKRMTLLLTVHLITLTHIVNLRQIILNREI